MADAIEVRRVREEEIDEYFVVRNFGWGRPDPTEEDLNWLRKPLELDRSLAAFDQNQIVATLGTISKEIIVPGGKLKAGYVGHPGVVTKQTHRRRGLMSQMMRSQLQDMYEREEALSVLRASESIIYGRFGYGMATFEENWVIDRNETQFHDDLDHRTKIELVERDFARSQIPKVYDAASKNRYGMLVRKDIDWDKQLYGRRDLPTFGLPEREMMYALYGENGAVDGYMMYQAHPNEQWVRVYELMANNIESYSGLWRFAFDLDLIRTVEAFNRPVDEPLLWMLQNPRMLNRTPFDATWLRLVNVKKALTQRTYFNEGDLNLEIIDTTCQWNQGTLKLSGGPDGSSCSDNTANPDLVLTSKDLASAYLGFTSFKVLSDAGRVEEKTSGALHIADSMFLSGRKPWGPFM